MSLTLTCPLSQTISYPQIVLSAVVAVSQCAVLYSPYYGAYPYAAYPTLAKSTITYKTSGKYQSQGSNHLDGLTTTTFIFFVASARTEVVVYRF
jgi:hypothetical protein